jgi:hypothetical protein
METIEVYNFLNGKNLCNIFASLIVNKINDKSPNANTEVSVINVGGFFVVKGQTSSDEVITVATIFTDFLKDYDEELSKKIRVIDIIKYSSDFKSSNIKITHNYNKITDGKVSKIKNLLDYNAKNKLYFNLKLIGDYVYYSCLELDQPLVLEILNDNFNGCNLVKIDMSNETYVSDRYYGLSNNNEKLYHLLLKNIANNVFYLGISKELNMSFYTGYDTKDISNLNSVFTINNNNHIVKTSWLESLILDVFPFNYDEIVTYFNLEGYDSSCEILNNVDSFPWEKLDRIGEMVLI